jgi:hypothetical protein
VRIRLLRVLAVAVCLLGACAQGSSSIGPLTIDVPEGWLVTDREASSLKLTDGTIADENATTPGTAKAVFDVYVDTSQTVAEFRKVLRDQKVRASEQGRRINGYDAVILSYGSSAFGPRSDVVFFPQWRVQIIYRAAYPNDEAAFFRGRPAFRRALASIRFSGRPLRRA